MFGARAWVYGGASYLLAWAFAFPAHPSVAVWTGSYVLAVAVVDCIRADVAG